MRAHERVTEGMKVGAVTEFLGKETSVVDFSGNVFYLDFEVLLLELLDFFLSGVDMIEAFCRFCFVQFSACTFVVVDGGG